MKRKERAHLKEDPFQIFIEKVLGVMRKYKHEIVIGLSVAVVLFMTLVVTLLIKSGSVSKDNRLYSEALSIKESEALTIDQKIEKLYQLKNKKGISSSIKLAIAALYFEKGDLSKAKEVLDTFKGSKFRLINDQQTLLEADILNASGRGKEAVDLLFKMFSDPETKISKDYILLKMARFQARTGQTGTAITNLKKIEEEFPQSPYSPEVNILLAQLENQ